MGIFGGGKNRGPDGNVLPDWQRDPIELQWPHVAEASPDIEQIVSDVLARAGRGDPVTALERMYAVIGSQTDHYASQNHLKKYDFSQIREVLMSRPDFEGAMLCRYLTYFGAAGVAINDLLIEQMPRFADVLHKVAVEGGLGEGGRIRIAAPPGNDDDPSGLLHSLLQSSGLSYALYSQYSAEQVLGEALRLFPELRNSRPKPLGLTQLAADPNTYWAAVQSDAGSAVFLVFGPESDSAVAMRVSDCWDHAQPGFAKAAVNSGMTNQQICDIVSTCYIVPPWFLENFEAPTDTYPFLPPGLHTRLRAEGWKPLRDHTYVRGVTDIDGDEVEIRIVPWSGTIRLVYPFTRLDTDEISQFRGLVHGSREIEWLDPTVVLTEPVDFANIWHLSAQVMGIVNDVARFLATGQPAVPGDPAPGSTAHPVVSSPVPAPAATAIQPLTSESPAPSVTIHPGANKVLPASSGYSVQVNVRAGVDLVVLCVRADGTVDGDNGVALWSQPQCAGGAVQIAPQAGTVAIDAGRLPAEVARVLLVAQVADASDVGRLGTLSAVVAADGRPEVELRIDQPPALPTIQVGELYRHQAGFKTRCLGDGYADGLGRLLEVHGIEVTPTVEPPAPPPQTSGLLPPPLQVSSKEEAGRLLDEVGRIQRQIMDGGSVQGSGEELVSRVEGVALYNLNNGADPVSVFDVLIAPISEWGMGRLMDRWVMDSSSPEGVAGKHAFDVVCALRSKYQHLNPNNT